ncbi:unnamed protein product [Rotaria sordida]|uniref:Uncharacterized protein n=1 Tax=Rotaria sordida TaxID=392033 RepID=A0A819S1L8_9BILA|nr:unnamed protein product [Rotaria sordida]CAF1414798.1 unnamed protein product [Rotaria sordida]CAF4056944.1 unnamed protein product [Rotaria sordida]CAF4191062.1 unnamed protein product [Rotaria sordida]
MGCVSAVMSSYTQEELDAELAAFVPRLPMAVLMNGGIIKLEGLNGFFNPNSLLDPSWLKDKMTAEEFYQAIDLINKRSAYTQVGMSRIYWVTEKVNRDRLRTEAGMTAVQEINRRNPSVRFTYHETLENMQMSLAWSNDPALRLATKNTIAIGNGTVTILYIRVN